MIGKLTAADISQVARLHHKELSGFLPELGQSFLENFYEASRNLPEMFTFVYLDEGKIKGFVSSINNSRGLFKKIISQRPLNFSLLFLKYFIAHPSSIVKIFKILTYPGFKEGGAELLTLAVGREYQKQGIGRKLFKKTQDEFRKRKISRFRISVYDRLPANGFYRKIGCHLEKSFIFLNEKMNYYFRDLSQTAKAGSKV